MKKTFIILINVIIMAAILIFVVFYSGFESRESYRRQIEHFENTTVTMERVTENYLEGEQRICDVWASYINSRTMTMEEAVDYSTAAIPADARTWDPVRPRRLPPCVTCTFGTVSCRARTAAACEVARMARTRSGTRAAAR